MTPDFEDLDLRPAPPKPAQAPLEDLRVGLPPRSRRRTPGARAILFAGVAGACALGVGLGLWARPAMHERRVAVAAPEPEAPPVDPNARRLKIVIGDGPAAPVGAPIETLRAAPRPMFATLRPRQDGQTVMGAVPELTRLEPKPLPKLEGPKLQMPHLEAPHIDGPKLPDLAPLMVAAAAAPRHWLDALKPAERPSVETARAEPPKTHAMAAPARRLQLAEADQANRAAKAAEAQAARDAARQAQAEARAEAQAEATAAAEKAAIQKAALQRAAAEKAEAHRLALAQAAKQQQAKLQQAKLQQAKLEQAREAKAEQVRQAKADKAEKLRLARAQRDAQKAEATKLAQAEAKGRAEARAEAKALVLAQARDEAKKRQRLEALVHAVQKVLPHAQTQPVQTARLDRRHAARRQDAVVERASLKPRKAPHAVEPAARSHPVQIAPAEPSGLVKVSTPRCASRDPGAALVCADPTLSAADRQMARAYQGARAAGVPDSQLQAQQQRWLAARSAAAREAPWAMRDVYLARIAELNGQAREAHADGY